MTLAPKLPYTHPFAGGYPRLGGQPLPTDPDAIDYLERVAAADGAAVEVGVAMAVDAFVRGCKADGIWDAIKASCIMCGARTIGGALVPLVGAAPTNVADGFVSGDYNRETGLKGDGTSYLQTGFENTALTQNNAHCAVYATEHEPGTGAYIGAFNLSTGDCQITGFNATNVICRFMASNGELIPTNYSQPFFGAARTVSATYVFRDDGSNNTISRTSGAPTDMQWCVFDRSTNATHTARSSARIAFYSIGETLDLEALDARATALVTAIGAAV